MLITFFFFVGCFFFASTMIITTAILGWFSFELWHERRKQQRQYEVWKVAAVQEVEMLLKGK